MAHIQEFEEIKLSIIEKIKKLDYPQGHPFLKSEFINDFYCVCLAIFQQFYNGELIIDDLLNRKLKGIKNKQFDFNSFQEGIGEFNVLYYLMTGINYLNEDQQLEAIGMAYEPPALVENKTLEYVIDINYNSLRKHIAVEVKTISSAPEFKEKVAPKIGSKCVKKFFPDVSLEHLKARPDYNDLVFLDSSSHSRQFTKNIKAINEKFKKYSSVINVGFLIFQYATSIEEMFSYIFNEKYGTFTRNPSFFENIDALVIFSMTSTPDLFLNDLYEKNHVLTISLTDEQWKNDVLKSSRLDNYIYSSGKITDDVLPHINKDFGVYTYKQHDKVLYFINEDFDNLETQQQASEISSKLHKNLHNK